MGIKKNIMKKQILLFCIIISLIVGCQEEYEKFEDLGDSKMKNKDYDGAIIEYTNAIKSNPEIAYLYKQRGMAKHEKSDFQGAIDDVKIYDRVINNEEIKTLGGESKDAILNTIKEIKDILIISCSWEK